MARTIVIGNDTDLVRNIMYCLTYFIRCSEVYERTESRIYPSTRHRVLSASSNSSGSTLVGDTIQCVQPDVITSHGHDCTTDSESELVERTRERIHSMTRNSSRKSISGLCDLVKYERSTGVERQEGEGDEEDSFLDEQIQKVQLRTRRPMNEIRGNLCMCKKSDRHGVIFETVSDVASSPMINSIQVVERDPSCGLSRDSGIESFVEMEGTKVLINNGQTKNSVVMHGKLKRKPVHGKVSFTIGNIPLEDICSPTRKEGRESSPVSDCLVCTCGKHVPGGVKGISVLDSKSSTAQNGFERTKNPPKISLSAVNAKLLEMRKYENENSTTEFCGDFSPDVGLSKNSSLACDSGIHSCEDSRTDLVHCRTYNVDSNNGVGVLQIKFPQIKREHVRNVGRSGSSTPWVFSEDSDTCFTASLPSNKMCNDDGLQNNVINQHGKNANSAAFNQNGINAEQRMNLSVVHREKSQCNDYDHSNSMFDEYFDENIELKMLDEESFQERLKQRKSKKTQGTVKSETNASSCDCIDSKCFSRDSLLDGQEEARCCEGHLPKDRTLALPQCPNMENYNLCSPDDDNDCKFIENAVEIELPK